MDKEPIRLSLAEFNEAYADDWVDIKPIRSWAAQQRIDSTTAIVRAQMQAGMETADVQPDLLGYGLAILRESVVAWSLPFPASEEGYLSDDFDGALGDWLTDAIEAKYEELRRGKLAASASRAISMAR